MTEIRGDLENLLYCLSDPKQNQRQETPPLGPSHFQDDASKVSRKTSRNTGGKLCLETKEAKGRRWGAFLGQIL